MLGTANDVIRLVDGTVSSWADFSAEWYLARYPQVRALVSADDPRSVLAYYLTTGQGLGHAPNPFFDETWHLRQFPGVAAAVRDGRVASGFDDYCRAGYRGRSPHWLYEDYLYRISGEPLSLEVVQAAGFLNCYDHYIRRGSLQGRIAHRLFDPAYYRAQLAAADAEGIERLGPFRHFLFRIDANKTEPRASIYFDPAWYVERYPAVKAEIGTTWQCALHHYLTNPTPTEFDPLPEFSEESYLRHYQDVATTIADGGLRNGYWHFVNNGVLELRTPSDIVDLKSYVSSHPSVTVDLQAGRARDAFAHMLTIGRATGIAPALFAECGEDEKQANALFRLRAENLLPAIARRPIDFSYQDVPDIAVIMVLRDNFALTLQALASLRQSFAGSIQLILVDSGSTDETRFIGRYVRGAQVIRFDSDIGFVRACNAGRLYAAAGIVLFLNNDVELGPDAVGIARERLLSDPAIGAVGGKIVRTHGKLEEAGGIIWRDGVTLGYMRDASPLAPEANFVRDVDFCSAVFLAVRADLLTALDGFRDDYTPEYFEAADLCVRIAQAGYRVVYDPSIVVVHYEHASAPSLSAVRAQFDRARQVFTRLNMGYLRNKYIADQRATVFARAASEAHRILFIEDQVPLRRLGSGFVRSNDILNCMVQLGHRVTVFPVYPSRISPAGIYADMPDTVEVMYDRSLEDLAGFLESRDFYYDTIWIARTHNLDRARPALTGSLMGKGRVPRVILDTEAIGSLRAMARAELTGTPFDLPAALAREFQSASYCQGVVAVTEQEASHMRALGFADVAVVGHIRRLDIKQRPFARRAGMLFVGAIHDMDSPNYDSLCWFVDAVLPLVERELGYETRLTVAGFTAEGVTLERFARHPRITLLGEVADTRALYDRNRVFVAPTRFAAGSPYKVYEAASFGLPVVASDLLVRQLGWDSGRDILSAAVGDAEGFAAQVVSLCRDAEMWELVRGNAAERIRAENGGEGYLAALGAVLGGRLPVGLRRLSAR